MCQTTKRLEVKERARGLYHHAKFGGARISPAAGAAKNVEFFVRHAHLNAASGVRQVAPVVRCQFSIYFQ